MSSLSDGERASRRLILAVWPLPVFGEDEVLWRDVDLEESLPLMVTDLFLISILGRGPWMGDRDSRDSLWLLAGVLGASPGGGRGHPP